MRIRRLSLALMTVSFVGCDFTDDQAEAARAGREPRAGLPQAMSDPDIVVRRLSSGPRNFSAFDVAPDGELFDRIVRGVRGPRGHRHAFSGGSGPEPRCGRISLL